MVFIFVLVLKSVYITLRTSSQKLFFFLFSKKTCWCLKLYLKLILSLFNILVCEGDFKLLSCFYLILFHILHIWFVCFLGAIFFIYNKLLTFSTKRGSVKTSILKNDVVFFLRDNTIVCFFLLLIQV